MKKATEAEQALRIKAVVKLLIRNHPRPYILQYAAKNWGISDRTADELIARATDEILEANKSSIQMTISRVAATQWEILRKAMAKKDLFMARMVLMDIAKLQGIEKQTINHVIEDKRDLLPEMSDVELIERLAKESH